MGGSERTDEDRSVRMTGQASTVALKESTEAAQFVAAE